MGEEPLTVFLKSILRCVLILFSTNIKNIATTKFFPKCKVKLRRYVGHWPSSSPCFLMAASFLFFEDFSSLHSHLEIQWEMCPTGLHVYWTFPKVFPLFCKLCPQGLQNYLGFSKRVANRYPLGTGQQTSNKREVHFPASRHNYLAICILSVQCFC